MGSDGEERNMVQSLMEILHDRPEHEIYSVLKECGMDPDEAVQSLLSQGHIMGFPSLCFGFSFLHCLWSCTGRKMPPLRRISCPLICRREKPAPSG